MNLPLYRVNEAQISGKESDHPSIRPKAGHAGLWHERFFGGYVHGWVPDHDENKKKWAEAKSKWIGDLRGTVGDSNACQSAAARQALLCKKRQGHTRVFTVAWHFATGLGNPHPVENGLLWHPTLGVPYIQGSAVKGLVRAWVEAWMADKGGQPLDSIERHKLLYRWFGSEDKDPKERKRLRIEGFVPPTRGKAIDTEVGAYIFFDALPVSGVELKPDVMTPHMGKWYEAGGTIESVERQSDRVPADWHDPVPVVFLVADRPTFQFCVVARTAAAQAELPQVMDALEQALAWLGAGAKTAVGYGQMSRNDAEEKAAGKARDELEERMVERMVANTKAAEMAQLSANRRAIEELRVAFATVRKRGRPERVSGQLYRAMRDLLDRAAANSDAGWFAGEKTELADLVAAEAPSTLELDSKAKEIRNLLKMLRGESF